MSAYILPAAAVLIVVVVALIGLRDLRDFRLRRVLAIGGVCFSESVRRRILWITPLAIVGIVSVTQLTRPEDEQDAIRQTIKYCLFASGLIVIVAAVILAATNLPKELESRVIFTIVTKPTTRLEIVLGKVLGFAQVSAMMLVIMGLFTWGYLRVRAWHMESRLQAALNAGAVDPASRATLEHYVRAGLLSTKSLAWPASLEVYARVPPPPGEPGLRWMGGGRQQFYLSPFKLTDAQTKDLLDAANGGKVLMLMSTLRVAQHAPTTQEVQDLKQGKFPVEADMASLVAGPAAPSTGPATAPAAPKLPLPQVAFEAFVGGDTGQPIEPDVLSVTRGISAPVVQPTPSAAPSGGGELRTYAAELTTPAMIEAGAFQVKVWGLTPTVEYGAEQGSTYLATFDPIVPHVRGAPAAQAPAPAEGTYLLYARLGKGDNQIIRTDVLKAGEPLGFGVARAGRVTAIVGGATYPLPDGEYFWLRQVQVVHADGPPKFQTSIGRSGMQIRGEDSDAGNPSVAVYHFNNPDVGGGDHVTLQMRLSIERAGDLDADRNAISRVQLRVRNNATGQTSPPVVYVPETSRFSYVDVAAEFCKGGNFDVLVRGLTPGQWIGVQGPTATTPSTAVVVAESFFEVNLIKSLLILWLLSVLVVVLAVFCSTFLSWPIAVVLTLLLLFGRWGVDQLGDALAPGSGRSMAIDIFGVRDPTGVRTMSTGMEALSTMLRNMGKVLPDVTRFPVIDDIDRGVSIAPARVGEALAELAWYGLPILMLTYLIFRNKEVAP